MSAFLQVVAAACRCLGSLASMEDKSAKHTIKVLSVVKVLRVGSPKCI